MEKMISIDKKETNEVVYCTAQNHNPYSTEKVANGYLCGLCGGLLEMKKGDL